MHKRSRCHGNMQGTQGAAAGPMRSRQSIVPVPFYFDVDRLLLGGSGVMLTLPIMKVWISARTRPASVANVVDRKAMRMF
jgi:hypothetical protein